MVLSKKNRFFLSFYVLPAIGRWFKLSNRSFSIPIKAFSEFAWPLSDWFPSKSRKWKSLKQVLLKIELITTQLCLVLLWKLHQWILIQNSFLQLNVSDSNKVVILSKKKLSILLSNKKSFKNGLHTCGILGTLNGPFQVQGADFELCISKLS